MPSTACISRRRAIELIMEHAQSSDTTNNELGNALEFLIGQRSYENFLVTDEEPDEDDTRGWQG